MKIKPGFTFNAMLGKINVPMKVMKIEGNFAACQSMDLKHHAIVSLARLKKLLSK